MELLDCATHLSALGKWGIGPQQLGLRRAQHLLSMTQSAWQVDSLSINYLAMEVRSDQPPAL